MRLINFIKRKANALNYYFYILIDILKKFFQSNNYYQSIRKYKTFKKALLLQTPEHYNIGDHAITFAEQVFLNDVLAGIPVIEFSFNDIKYRFRHIKKIINEDDIIILHGGGNFGDLYSSEEKERTRVIKALKKNRILIMPQSINFSDTARGRKMLKRAQKNISSCDQLTILCRDFVSYNYAKEKFKCNTIACPDIVHYLHNYFDKYKTEERKGILFTFRNDKEKHISNILVNQIKEYIVSKEYDYDSIDTMSKTSAIKENRRQVIEDLIEKFYGAKLVITDRFHGMVFSIITETPCIVMKSLDHKIESGYKWYPENSNILFLGANSSEEIRSSIDQMTKAFEGEYVNEKDRVYTIIYNILKEWI